MSRGGNSTLRAVLRTMNVRFSRQPGAGGGEPRRLVEMSEVSDPNLRWGAELVRRAGSIEPSRLMQARVRERLAAAHAPLRRNVRWVRWAPLAALLFAAGAGATIGRDWVRDFVDAVEEAPLAKPHGHDELSATGAPLPRVAPVAPPEDVEPRPSLEITAPVAADNQVETPRGTTVRKAVASTAPKGASAPSEAEPPPASVQAQNQGSQLMVDALQARRAKRYGEASKLAQQYLNQYPRGPLAEEALGLVMEAAANTGSGQRHALARRYLQRFPNGRFTATAQRILQAP